MKKILINIKNQIKEFRKKSPMLLFFIIANFINGIILRLITTGSFSIRALLFDFGFVLLLGAFSIPVKKKKRYYYLVSSLMVICCIINTIYYNYYTSFVSFSLINTSKFLKDVSDTLVDIIIRPTDLIYLWIFIGFYIINKKINLNKNKEENVVYGFKKMILISISILCIGCVLPPYYSFSRFIKLWNRVSVVNNFGIYLYQMDDLVQSLKPSFNNMFGHDNALKEVKDYFQKNKNVPVLNDYTEIFKGKNVISIHAESLQDFTLGLSFNGKEVTPNINKLVNTGLYFSNFYTQVGVGTSSDSEFTYATSLLPSNNGTVFVNYYDNKFKTIQNSLRDSGYYVFSMHGNVGNFWNRDVMHLNMGYDKFYSKDSFVIDEEYGLGLSDKSFFRQAVSLIKDINDTYNKPYYGTLITLTNHTPWNDVDKYSDYDLSLNVKVNGEKVVRDYINKKVIGRYIKAVNYMDEAIGQFIEDMDSEGLLDNTVIVIYGDHDARIDKRQYDYMYNYDPIDDRILSDDDPNYKEFNDYDYEINKKVPFIIWTKDMQFGQEIDTPMGMIDVSPTLGNMLGVYNSYALGRDIMNLDKSEGIVVFKDGSYITDKIYYNARKSEVYVIGNGIIEENYIANHSKYADELISISYNIITYDLFNELE